MIQVTHLSDDRTALVTGGEALLDRPGLKWVDVQGPTEEALTALGTRFGLHRLAIEDCLHLDQRPKLEEYPNHHFVVLHGFSASDGDPCELTLHELHVFLGPDFVITVHQHPHRAIADATRRMQGDPANTFGRGADFIAYMVADALVDRNFPILDQFYVQLEELEEQIFEAVHEEQLQRIFALKRSLVQYRKVLSPQRDVVGVLMRGGLAHVQQRTTLYFRDVYDHLIRVNEGIDAARDLLANARDAWISSMANRTNDITKQLTIFATIFLPLSFITGFFGQNFDVLSRPVFFWSMLTLIVLFPVALIGWFHHKRWF